MAQKIYDNIIIENAHLIFKNFSGKEDKFNPEGRRSFCVIIDDLEMADHLKQAGWNIRYLPAREEGDPDTPYLNVAVSYANVPPKIYKVTSKNKTLLDEESVGTLDYDEIENVDLVIRPYNWEVNGRSGVKAYISTMYVTILEDVFADKYSDTSDEAPF